jgi:4-amino-4-deoxy-L-arabinose transferase-like glycosyltransferase
VAALLLRAGAAVHHVRVDYDEGRYLDNAVHLLAGNGFATSTVAHFFGDPPRPPRPEDVSSPLYPIFLAGVFSITGVSFAAARAASVVAGAAAVFLTYAVGRRLFGAAPALAAAAALAVQPDQAIVGSWAMTEPIYTVGLLAALAAAAGLESPKERPPAVRRACLLGVLCGILYLIRQNGAAAAAALAALLVLGPLAPRERRARRALLGAAMAASAFVVCLPWFVRNVGVFGSPAFTRMKNIAWADHGRSLYTLGEGEPSLRAYLEEHGAAGLAANLIHRARRVAVLTVAGEEGPFRWLSVLALAAPFLPGLRRGSAVVLPPALLSAALLVGVAPWSGAVSRYLLPVRPLLYLAGAAVAGALLRLALGRLPAAGLRARRAPAAGALALLAAWGAVSGAPTYRAYMMSDQAAADATAREAAAWIAERTDPGDVILEGGYLHQYAFLFRRGVVWVPYGDLAALRQVARNYSARFLAVTPEVIRFRPQLAPHWRAEGRSIVEVARPDGLVPALDHASGGVILYRLADAPDPMF